VKQRSWGGELGAVTATISLCVCTMNRPQELDRALASVRAGTKQPHELVVSDDGHDEATKGVAERHGAIYQPGPARGLAANRNACLDLVTGSHVVFIDDDVAVGPRFIETAMRVASNDVVTGWERNHAGGQSRRVEPSNPGFLGFQDQPVLNERKAIVINATVFPGHLFARARFTEQSRYGYEELDMARQAVASGYRIVFADDLFVDHFPSAVNRDQYARVLVASRLYLTARAYRRYERRPMKALAFCLVAPMHHVLSEVRAGRHGFEVLRPIGLAWSYAREASRQSGIG